MNASVIKGATDEEDVVVEHTIKDEDTDTELNNFDDWLEELNNEEIDKLRS